MATQPHMARSNLPVLQALRPTTELLLQLDDSFNPPS